MALRPDGGWTEPRNFTTRYSGFLKISRALVVLSAVWKREHAMQRIREQDPHLKLCEVEDRSPTIHSLVRKPVERYMTFLHAGNQPSPVDWVLSIRQYGMALAKQYAAPGRVAWDYADNAVIYDDVRLSVSALSSMVHQVAAEAESILVKLLLLRTPAELPHLDLRKLLDIPAETAVGFNFISESQRQGRFSVDGQGWLWNRIINSKLHFEHFVT